jgi:hypothetical protein
MLANFAYCAAYVVDIFASASGCREQWWKLRIIFTIGLLFAAITIRFFVRILRKKVTRPVSVR